MTSPPPKPPNRSGKSNAGRPDPGKGRKSGQAVPRTVLGSITQAFQTVQANVDFSKISLKPNARVPKLHIESDGKHSEYPLVGEHYLLGRSSKACDIVVRSPIISQTHLALTRDRSRPGNPFVIRDKGSTNGIYRNKKRLKSLPLRHGDVLTLGPRELADAVTVRYIDPPPAYLNVLRYGLYGATGFTSLLILWIVGLQWPKISTNPLPDLIQGPVLITADGEDGRREPINDLPNISHRRSSGCESIQLFCLRQWLLLKILAFTGISVSIRWASPEQS